MIYGTYGTQGGGSGGASGFTIADNGLQALSATTVGLGGNLMKNTSINTTGAFQFSIVDTQTPFTSHFYMGHLEVAPGINILIEGFIFNNADGGTAQFGRLETTEIGGSDKLTAQFTNSTSEINCGLSVEKESCSLIYSDSTNGIGQGLSILKTQLTCSIYTSDGETQVGFTAYDGTGGFTLTADMFYFDVLAEVDISLIQTKQNEILFRYCYNVVSELYNNVQINAIGAIFNTLQVVASNLGNYANDAAAAAAGVPLMGLYHTAGSVNIRIV